MNEKVPSVDDGYHLGQKLKLLLQDAQKNGKIPLYIISQDDITLKPCRKAKYGDWTLNAFAALKARIGNEALKLAETFANEWNLQTSSRYFHACVSIPLGLINFKYIEKANLTGDGIQTALQQDGMIENQGEFNFEGIGMVHSCYSPSNDDTDLAIIHSYGMVQLKRSFQYHWLAGLEDFSHCWIFFLKNQTEAAGQTLPPQVDMALCEIDRIKDSRLWIKNHSLIYGTIVLDIKPFHPLDMGASWTQASSQHENSVGFSPDLFHLTEQSIGFAIWLSFLQELGRSWSDMSTRRRKEFENDVQLAKFLKNLDKNVARNAEVTGYDIFELIRDGDEVVTSSPIFVNFITDGVFPFKLYRKVSDFCLAIAEILFEVRKITNKSLYSVIIDGFLAEFIIHQKEIQLRCLTNKILDQQQE